METPKKHSSSEILNLDMYLQRRKRTKLDNEDNNYHYKSEVTALCSGFEKTKEKSSSKVRDYSNPLALSNLLESLDDGIYGSVTKEYETLHAQRMQVIKFLSTLQPSLANSYPSLLSSSHRGINAWSDLSTRGNQNSDRCVDSSISSDIIDLEADSIDAAANTSMRMSAEKTHDSSLRNISYCGDSDYMMHRKIPDVANGPSDSCPKYKEGKDSTSVIILDSDDEDAIHQTGSQHASHSGRKSFDLQTLIGTQIESLRRQAMITQETHLNQIIPYDYGSNKLDGSVAFKANWQPSVQYQKVVLQKVPEKQRFQDLVNQDYAEKRSERQDGKAVAFEMTMEEKTDVNSTLVSSAAVQEHSSIMGICQQDKAENLENDEHQLDDLWKEMSLAMECSKSPRYDEPAAVQEEEEEEEEECKHSPVLRDDLGIVCRICGVIQRSIDTIFEYQWAKAPRAARTHMSGSRNTKDVDETLQYSGPKFLENFIAADISIHPRHLKQMKPHQLEGFNFLVRNLVNDKPGGCILAHAPGSGKTFMLISFVQSFLAKYPFARPLVVLPKGILPIWKKEFQRWQVEDIPLYDFYSSRADNRSQQLEILHSWQENNSILFLGYKQFTNIICDNDTSKIASACRESLLKVPTLLILDEGHTPRNENTYVLDSLAKVQTHRKVVLSGTLFQNHVREVFTILNLVRPKFLRLDTSRDAVGRILSRVDISACKRLSKSSKEKFYDLVEETLQHDDNFKRKIRVIQDLREMTKDVLHYYKGDFLDELPGLVDFTVLLKLGARQKTIVQTLEKFEKFKKSSVGSAVYIHPHLLDISQNTAGDRVYFNDEKIDGLLDSVNVRDGVKTRFFLNILSLSESAGEKVLAFSQYILPLKFLERLLVKMKGWHSGKEIFMICGDSSPEQRELSMEQFNNSPDAKVFFGSIKACGEGISLVGASRVVILDVHLNPSVTRQAIGRTFRPGQEKKVYTYRLVAADSPEEEDHRTSFRKELISKMWFEWSEYCDHRDFELDEIDIASCEDMFLESPILSEDVKVLYRR